MSWKQEGKDGYDRVDIKTSNDNEMIRHARTNDTKYGSDKKITTERLNGDESKGESYRKTTIHGNDWINKK